MKPGLLAVIEEKDAETAAFLRAKYAEFAGGYQPLLIDFIKEKRPRIVVETGVRYGFSTDCILTALDELGQGYLYSIDPEPCCNLSSFYHPRWQHYADLSTDPDGLVHLAHVVPDWDLFLHDSDHGAPCQIFEYSLAYQRVVPGGWILSDDWNMPHGAWKRFCELHGLTFTTMSTCAVAQKPAP